MRLKLVYRLKKFYTFGCLLLTEQSSLLQTATLHVGLRLCCLAVVIRGVVNVHSDPIHASVPPRSGAVRVVIRCERVAKRDVCESASRLGNRCILPPGEQSIVDPGQGLLIVHKQVKQVVLISLRELFQLHVSLLVRCEFEKR